MELDDLKKREIQANINKLEAEARSIPYRDGLETLKVFMYGFVCAAALIAAITQVIKAMTGGA